MNTYAVLWTYTADAEQIARHRDSHMRYIKGLATEGAIVEGGAWRDGSGALIIFRASDRKQLKGYLDADPFTTEGVIVATQIHEWSAAIGPIARI
ncbi:MAG: YciI family protein [Methylophilaceae bacterium]|uniref:YciI family protein n=1 Tax=Methylibium sp. TaxID=2067992 RepID=UPI0035989930